MENTNLYKETAENLEKLRCIFEKSPIIETFHKIEVLSSQIETFDMHSAVSILQKHHLTGITAVIEAENFLQDLHSQWLQESQKLQNYLNSSVLAELSCIDFNMFNELLLSLPNLENFSKSFNIDLSSQMNDNINVTNEDISEEICNIIKNKTFSPVETWNNFKKTKWFIAMKIIIFIVSVIASPVIEKVKDKALDYLGINEFWEKTGIYEFIDSFDANNVTEETTLKNESDINKTIQ